ncbi:ABC transporter permease [Streptomyces mirabilis]|uniref:ABC transporter permease n=1 Tax=Streptomyces mirabilis TaxID=68239 RepID=UPI003680E2D1
MTADQSAAVARTIEFARWKGHRARVIVLQITVFAVVLGTWQASVAFGWLDQDSVPSATATIAEMVDQIASAAFWDAVGSTAEAWISGLALSVALAIPLGVLLGSSRFAYQSASLVVDFLRTVPSITLLPLAVLLFGVSLKMELLIIVFGAVWPLLLQTAYGCRSVDRVASDTFAVFHVRRRMRITLLVLPSAAPYVATGLRLASTFCLIGAVGTELLGGAPGLGHHLALAQSLGTPAEVFAVTVIIGLFGLGLAALLAAGERRVLHWHPSFRRSHS